MSLPSFPSGINTELRDKKPIPLRRPKPPKRPRDPRRTFLAIFIVLMILIATFPAFRDWLAHR
ncbi:MAG: hypothetical protein GIW97_06865 [Candidatus Eremiobacteraeota bacterium]|nr:hypothetical protein [Candidatus Eremiobacteraeota bacterium]